MRALYLLVLTAILSVRGLFAHVHEPTLAEGLVVVLPFMAAMGFVPPPASEINGHYTWSTMQESNWKDYFERHPYHAGRNLPWLFGSYEAPVFVSSEVGEGLLFEYSNDCLNWGGVPTICLGPVFEQHIPSGKITQVSYHLISVTGILVRVKIKFYGVRPEGH